MRWFCVLLITSLVLGSCSDIPDTTGTDASNDVDVAIDATSDASDAKTADSGRDSQVDSDMDTEGPDTDDAGGDADAVDSDVDDSCTADLVHGEGEPLATLNACDRLSYGLYANHGQTRVEHRLPDFSFAGYRRGGVAIPDVPVQVTVTPGDGDDRQRIQNAIDQVSARSPDADGFRGAVLLEAGTYQVDGSLEISTSGVVLRGEGQSDSGTVLEATLREQHDFIQVSGGGVDRVGGTTRRITSDYVPVGARSFRVETADDVDVGDIVGVVRTPNQAWIDALDMAQWGWTPGGYEVVYERVVTDVSGDTLTVDIPMVDTIESQYGGGEVFLADVSERVERTGVEKLRLVSHYDGAEDEEHAWKAIRLRGVSHSWVRGVTAVHFGYAAVSIERESSFNTVQDTAMLEPVSQVTGARRYSFNVDDSTGNLFQRCYSEQARHDFVAGSKTPGPNVWLDCYSVDSTNDDGPHHRWSTGLLFDNVRSYELHVENRQDSGSGHGWSGAQTLFWNSIAEGLRSFAPEAAMNWVVGSMGAQQEGQWTTEEPLGWWESHDDPVDPRSLYLQQLEDRLGASAVEAITMPAQRDGRIWDLLAAWRGQGALSDATFAGGDPDCADGIRSGHSCCPAACGSCGGSGCGSRPGGASDCCTSAIAHSSRSCLVYEAPCIVEPNFAPIP